MAEEIVVVTQPSSIRRRGVEIAIGVLVGLVIACLNGPWLVSLLYTPPSGDTLSCGGPVTNALAYFVKLQLISGLLGGTVLFLVSFLFRRMLRKRREARTVPSA
ncbi:MAG TPA: hypothetical protein VEQ58_21090 [Polyangiaceae bacterium]|nr:hypothetical protein [Polyangiaceae bacterium]